MLTLRQLERLWNTRSYDAILSNCMHMRPEDSVRLRMDLAGPIPAAAYALVRLDELNQAAAPFCQKLIRAILTAQEADGGWGDLVATAICLRALMCSRGQGPAIDRGLDYLASLQKPEGLFPRVPIRRLPADAFVSAYVLLQLGEDERFTHNIRVTDLLRCLDAHHDAMDLETAKIWRSLSIRYRIAEAHLVSLS